ncbi:MAG: hypothetical protein HDQ95_14830 [Roseburia sp.]|nr:hypothetical protein [Roseburia sp.]
MKRKQLWKVLGSGMLALSLLISPLAGVSAWAAPEDEEQTEAGADADEAANPEGGSALDLDPLQDEEIPAVGEEEDDDYVPAKPAYEDVEIPVWGFTEDAVVYSVDVEWGAMTFQWENSSWDPKTHKEIAGAGWKVYDDTKSKALDETETLINEVKVTNHSNAPVWATLTYAGETDYDPDTTGDFSFETGTDEEDTDVLTAAAGDVPAYLALATADNGQGEEEGQGKATVGKAYFMPDGLDTDLQKDDGIAKWTKIGTITVSIKTEQPKAATTPEETEPETTEP